MKMYRTIRYRLHPGTQAKVRKLHALAGACRYVWNHFVGVLRDEYEAYGKCDPHWYSLLPRFTNLRRADPWLQDYSSAIVRYALKPIEVTYKQFWKGEGGLPKFHGKHTHAPSIPFSDNMFKMQGEYLHIARIGQLKLTGHNPYPDGVAKSGTIKYEAGRWYAYIVYEAEVTKRPESVKPVGIDRNIRNIALSDGTLHYMPQMDRLEARKRRYQRMMARRQCGNRKQGIKPSNRYLKAKQLHARTQQKIVHERANWCHQVSREIADKYNVAYMEDLNTKGMVQSDTKELNRKILMSGWGKLEQCLSYKSNVVKVAPHYTSQMCAQCGHVDKQNRKTQADFECTACGHRDNADVNAALNILAFGNGASGRGGGGVTRPVKRQTGIGPASADFDT